MAELSSKLRERRARIGENDIEGHKGNGETARKDSLVYLASKQIVTLRRWRRKSSRRATREKHLEAMSPGVEGLDSVDGHSGTDGESSELTSEEGEDDEREAEALHEPVVQGAPYTLALNGQLLGDTSRNNGNEELVAESEEPGTVQLNGEPLAKTTGTQEPVAGSGELGMVQLNSEPLAETTGTPEPVAGSGEPGTVQLNSEPLAVTAGSMMTSTLEPDCSERQAEAAGFEAPSTMDTVASEKHSEAPGGFLLAQNKSEPACPRQTVPAGPAAELAPEPGGPKPLHHAGELPEWQCPETDTARCATTSSTSGSSEQRASLTSRLFNFLFGGVANCCTLRERFPSEQEATVRTAQPCEEMPGRRRGRRCCSRRVPTEDQPRRLGDELLTAPLV